MNESNESIEIKYNVAPPQYFSVAPFKFILMSAGTFGIYNLYWVYKNWTYLKRTKSLKIMPWARAIFSPFWNFSLFQYIYDEAQKNSIPTHVSPIIWGLVYFILSAVWRLPDPYWLVTFFAIVPLLVANNVVTEIKQKADASFEQNSSIRGWNWLAVTLGCLFFLFSVYVTFFPPEA